MSILSQPIPKEIYDRLRKKAHSGISNMQYREAINLFEKYHRLYTFDDKLLYQLGLLYDHEAVLMQKIDQEKARGYLEKAQAVYTDIIKRNPQNFFALYGLARVFANRKEYSKAIRHARRAYLEKNKLPSGQKGALPVGSFYEQSGDFKNAEHWYKKELKDLGGNEFGATMNLLMFYNRTKQYRKAYSLALIGEQLMKEEFKKDIYKYSSIKKGKAMKAWKEEIQKAKNWIKNEPNRDD